MISVFHIALMDTGETLAVPSVSLTARMPVGHTWIIQPARTSALQLVPRQITLPILMRFVLRFVLLPNSGILYTLKGIVSMNVPLQIGVWSAIIENASIIVLVELGLNLTPEFVLRRLNNVIPSTPTITLELVSRLLIVHLEHMLIMIPSTVWLTVLMEPMAIPQHDIARQNALTPISETLVLIFAWRIAYLTELMQISTPQELV